LSTAAAKFGSKTSGIRPHQSLPELILAYSPSGDSGTVYGRRRIVHSSGSLQSPIVLKPQAWSRANVSSRQRARQSPPNLRSRLAV
jgi:hypothetical protein